VSKEDNQAIEDDERPHRSLWANLPRGSIRRIFLLLVLLGGVIYLQRRSGDIAGCANQTFNVSTPSLMGTSPDNSVSPPVPIRARVVLPEKTAP